jgi:hypothetical protein
MKHHYIPCFYTRRWTDKSKRLISWTRKNGKLLPKPHAPAHVGYEPNLYAKKKTNEIEKHSIETELFAKIDDKAAKVFNNIENKGLKSLTTQEMHDLCLFISTLSVRSSESVNNASQNSKHFHKTPDTARRNGFFNFDDDIAVNTIAGMCDLKSKHFKYAKTLHDCLMNMNWGSVDFFETKVDLLTSDNPINIFMFKDANKFSSVAGALNSGNGLLTFPLSPTVCLFASKNVKSLETDKAQLVELINHHIALGAQNYIYSTNIEVRTFIESRFKIM